MESLTELQGVKLESKNSMVPEEHNPYNSLIGDDTETSTDWLSEEINLLRVLHEKLKGKFKSSLPLPADFDQIIPSEKAIDD